MTQVLAKPRGLKHVQVREYVRELLSGCAPGTPAPSERELVQRFGVARMTVRHALDALVTDGLLERIPGRGTFVAPPHRMDNRLVGFTEEMARRGIATESRTVVARLEQAGPGVARALNLSEGDSVIHWRRLRHGDGLPICIEDAYLNEVLLPGFIHTIMPPSLYQALSERGLRPTAGEDSISASTATDEEAALLEVTTGEVVLRHSRRALAGDVVVEVSRSVYVADKFTVFVQLGQAR